MTRLRFIASGALLSGVALLTGCVAVPGGYSDGYYNSYPTYPSYGYGYAEPAPLVVPSTSVYVDGGYRRGYYDHPRYGRYPRGGPRWNGQGVPPPGFAGPVGVPQQPRLPPVPRGVPRAIDGGAPLGIPSPRLPSAGQLPGAGDKP